MILKLGMKHLGIELYKVCINHDLDLSYGKVNIGRPCIFRMGKNRKMSFNGRKLARNEQMDRSFMLMIIF